MSLKSSDPEVMHLGCYPREIFRSEDRVFNIASILKVVWSCNK